MTDALITDLAQVGSLEGSCRKRRKIVNPYFFTVGY